MSTLQLDDLIFVGLTGTVVALDRYSGETVWTNTELKSGYVSLLLDGDRLVVSTNGYMYCLDPLTGAICWHNPLKGIRCGPTHITSVRGQSSQTLIQQAAEVDEEQAGAAAAAAASSSAASS